MKNSGSKWRCDICGCSDGNRTFTAREMMFGYRDEFLYFECRQCGCVQIEQLPQNLMKYYPPEYSPKPPSVYDEGLLKRFMLKQRAAYCLHGHNLIGRMLAWKCGRPKANIFGNPDYYAWLRQCGVCFKDRILDVGCGEGHLLVSLWRDGFRNLVGVDPFIPETRKAGGRFIIWKKDLFQINGVFDLVMMHHSFEHMPKSREVLLRVFSMLRPGGNLLIRIPVASSWAFRNYQANWVQLDPPRHCILHTVKSMQLLAKETGFSTERVEFDSNGFQFWASEQYVQDIPLRDKRSYMTHPDESIFTQAQISKFESQAVVLNEKSEGDSACFYLRKT